jgi:nucleoside-diphosphate-sugar epimerase
VLHLAANPSPSAKWDELLDSNIVGMYNMCVAAKSAGCRRLIYASSIHAVSGYPVDVQVKASDPPNPGDLYGVTKVFGEALCRYMAEQEGLSCIAVRIGGFQPREWAEKEESLKYVDAWVSRRDLQQLLCRTIDVEGVRFAVFNGISDNLFKRLDISAARELLGYEPKDDLTAYHPRLKELGLESGVFAHSLQDDQQESGIRADLR